MIVLYISVRLSIDILSEYRSLLIVDVLGEFVGSINQTLPEYLKKLCELKFSLYKMICMMQRSQKSVGEKIITVVKVTLSISLHRRLLVHLALVLGWALCVSSDARICWISITNNTGSP